MVLSPLFFLVSKHLLNAYNVPSTEKPNGPYSEQALNPGFISAMIYIEPTQVTLTTLAKCECYNLSYKIKLLTFYLMETLWVLFSIACLVDERVERLILDKQKKSCLVFGYLPNFPQFETHS